MTTSKLALITGASSGLGRAIAEALAERHISLILVARDEKKLQELARSLAVPTQIYPVDLAQPLERKKLTQLIQEKQPDLVINNAGFGLYGPVLFHSATEMAQIVEVNVQALMELSIESARALVQACRHGMIVNISSAAAFFSYPTFSVYAASKGFVNQFSEALDVELKPLGVRVLTVCPGQIDTEFRTRASGNYPQKKDKITMSAKTAAQLILKQVEKGKTLSIIDWRYQWLVALAKLLPKKLLQLLLKRSLRDRHGFF